MQHYRTVNPEEEWAAGIIGQFARYRVLIPVVGLDTVATIASAVHSQWHYAGAGVIVGLAIGGVGFTLRHFLLNRIKLEQALHAFFHECRDKICLIGSCQAAGERTALFGQFNNLAVQHVAQYFRTRSGSDDYGAAIRLAEEIDGRECYVTKARFGLDPSRGKTSEPLGCDEGLAHALRQQETQGVYIVPDVKAASTQPGWKKMSNDQIPDVKALMAAPINGWDGGEKSMFGILFVTSKSRAFYPAEVDAMKMFADALGTHYATIWGKIGAQP